MSENKNVIHIGLGGLGADKKHFAHIVGKSIEKRNFIIFEDENSSESDDADKNDTISDKNT